MLLGDIKALIEQSRVQVAVTVNSTISLLYWQVGDRIHKEVLQNQRAEYGKQTIHILSEQLSLEYGTGWGKRHLHHCMRFAEVFPDVEIVNALRTQLSWTHIRAILPIDDRLKREFYIEICKLEKWSTRTLQNRIDSLLYERTAISKKPEITIQHELEQLKSGQLITPDLVFRDPYFLDFLGLKDSYSEKDIESAILVELQKFIIELGTDFAFMARQKRITIDNEDYYLDLLFYHRRLKCLVVLDLKLGKFEAAHKGQMELCLQWLEKHETVEGENPPIGLILCATKNKEHIELLQLEKSNIKVAEYLTRLPDLKLLEQKLHLAVEIARQKHAANDQNS